MHTFVVKWGKYWNLSWNKKEAISISYRFSCAKCERPFRYGTEDTVTINRKTYHIDCLSCDKCTKPYDGSFSPDDFDQQALCRECSSKNQTKSATNFQSDSAESKNKYVATQMKNTIENFHWKTTFS